MLYKLKARYASASVKDRVLLIMFAVIFISCFTTYYYFDDGKSNAGADKLHGSLARDYYRSPLNMSDAYQYCVAEAQKQLGSSMRGFTMDEMSTRYKPEQSVFFIVLKVDVGTINDYREAVVYCDVDPMQHMVSYYKEVYPGEDRSILSRTIEFFADL